MILAYFSKDLTNYAVIFRAFGQKKQTVGNFEKTFRKFSKNFLGKLLQMLYFSIFFKKFNKPALIFRAFGRKTQIVGKFSKMFKIFLRKIAKNALL